MSTFPEFDLPPEPPPLELETMHRLIIGHLRDQGNYAALESLQAITNDASLFPRLLELIAYKIVSVQVHDSSDVPEYLPLEIGEDGAQTQLAHPASGRVTVLYLEIEETDKQMLNRYADQAVRDLLGDGETER